VLDDNRVVVVLVGLPGNGASYAPDDGSDNRPDARDDAAHDRSADRSDEGATGLLAAVAIPTGDHDGLPPLGNFLNDGFTFDDAISHDRTSGPWSPDSDRASVW